MCLTGLPAEEKNRLHRHVEQLGGRCVVIVSLYVCPLDTRHLQRQSIPHSVTPFNSYTRDLDTSKTTHLIAKDAEGAKYDTAVACPTIRVVSPAWLEECIQTGKRANERLYSLSNEAEKFPPLEQEVDLLLQTNRRKDLFVPCRFLLLGFDEETDIYSKLGKLIRRAKGTIYWELNEMITHIIVADDCDECHR